MLNRAALLGMLFLGACGGEHAPTAKFQVGEDDNGIGNKPVLTSSFQSIKSVLLERSCLSCHASGGRAANVPLETYSDLIDSPLELVIPGNPEESGLMISLTRTDSKAMPPRNAGVPLLTEAEIEVIRLWIQEGANP